MHCLILSSHQPPSCDTPGDRMICATRATGSVAQVWRSTSFRKRRLLLKVLQQYIIEHQAEICR